MMRFRLKGSKPELMALVLGVVLGLSAPALQAAEAYERGPGVALGACGTEEQKDGDLCYPKCKDKFKAEGDLCKQICPANTQDAETHCLSGPYVFRKATYPRGKGRAVDTCPEGSEKIGDLCFEPCKAGFKAAGKMCEPG